MLTVPLNLTKLNVPPSKDLSDFSIVTIYCLVPPAGSYVALTLLGKPNATGVPGVSGLVGSAKPPEAPTQVRTEPVTQQSNRVTAPQPVDVSS